MEQKPQQPSSETKKEPSKEPTEFVEPVAGHVIRKKDWDDMSGDEKQEWRDQVTGK